MTHSLKNKKILITCGPTWVPIDDMRVISNRSTGEMGHLITNACHEAGGTVSLLEGPVEKPFSNRSVRVIQFKFFSEFSKLLREEIKSRNYDIIIHAAAVSDYQLKNTYRQKIPSSRHHLCLDLIPTAKLITKIKKWSPRSLLVGFKLETRMSRKTAVLKSRSLFKDAACSLVIANSMNRAGYKGFLIDHQETVIASADTRAKMAKFLIQALKTPLR